MMENSTSSEDGHIPSESSFSFTINLSFGVIIVVMNLISLLLVSLGRSLPKKQKIMFSSLIVTDTLLGAQIVLARSIPKSYSSDHIHCYLRLCSGLSLAYVTILSNLLITIERFLTLTMPLMDFITWQKTAWGVGISWVIGTVLGFLTFKDGFSEINVCQYFVAGQPVGYLVFGILTCTAFVIIVIAYSYIAKQTRRHIRQIASTIVGEVTSTDGRRYLNKAELRATVTVGIIVGFFGVSYMPMAAYCVYSFSFISDPDSFVKTNNTIFAAMLHFFLLNSLVNPIVHIWRHTNSRTEVIRAILCRSETHGSSYTG